MNIKQYKRVVLLLVIIIITILLLCYLCYQKPLDFYSTFSTENLEKIMFNGRKHAQLLGPTMTLPDGTIMHWLTIEKAAESLIKNYNKKYLLQHAVDALDNPDMRIRVGSIIILQKLIVQDKKFVPPCEKFAPLAQPSSNPNRKAIHEWRKVVDNFIKSNAEKSVK